MLGQAHECLRRKLFRSCAGINAGCTHIIRVGKAIERVRQGLATLAEGGTHESGDQLVMSQRAFRCR